LETKIGAIAERFESEDLQFLQLKQRLLRSGGSYPTMRPIQFESLSWHESH
jgi:hypothetical protein